MKKLLLILSLALICPAINAMSLGELWTKYAQYPDAKVVTTGSGKLATQILSIEGNRKAIQALAEDAANVSAAGYNAVIKDTDGNGQRSYIFTKAAKQGMPAKYIITLNRDKLTILKVGVD